MSFNSNFFRYVFLFLMTASSPLQAQIELISTFSAGSGCPPGTTSVVLIPDNTVFSILYDQMETSAAGIRNEKRKQCDTTINLKLPAGKQLEFNFVRYNGFMGLENAASWGYVNSRAYFNGGTVQFPGQAPRNVTRRRNVFANLSNDSPEL